MDLKLECRIEVLRRVQNYDPGKNTKFTTYIHRYITDVMLQFRMEEEYSSFDSLQEYKDARQIIQLYTACHGNAKETIRLFTEKNQCSEETAAEKLAAAWRQRNRRVPVLLNDEGEGWEQADELIPDHWDYVDILWAGIEANMVDKAFNKLSYRDQRLLEKRNAICMRCGRVGDIKTQVSFQKLAEDFEGTGAPGAEKAYKRAVEKLNVGTGQAGPAPLRAPQANLCSARRQKNNRHCLRLSGGQRRCMGRDSIRPGEKHGLGGDIRRE